MSSRSYCFTSFLPELEYDENLIRYMILGCEIAPSTGKEHIQGYVEFNNKITFKKAQAAIGDPKCHLEKRRGTRDEARAYCMKEGNFQEIGNWEAGGQGARSDLNNLINKISQGATDYQLLTDDPEMFNRYIKFIERTRKIIQEENSRRYITDFASTFKPNPFQAEILETIKNLTEREVLWVDDPKGGSGKTWLSKYLLSQGAARFTNGKNADIAHAYNGEPIVIFDFSRTLDGRVNYDIIEALKNGLIFSGKYQSHHKAFKPPKVICLANFSPRMDALSLDRWRIYKIVG